MSDHENGKTKGISNLREWRERLADIVLSVSIEALRETGRNGVYDDKAWFQLVNRSDKSLSTAIIKYENPWLYKDLCEICVKGLKSWTDNLANRVLASYNENSVAGESPGGIVIKGPWSASTDPGGNIEGEP